MSPSSSTYGLYGFAGYQAYMRALPADAPPKARGVPAYLASLETPPAPESESPSSPVAVDLAHAPVLASPPISAAPTLTREAKLGQLASAFSASPEMLAAAIGSGMMPDEFALAVGLGGPAAVEAREADMLAQSIHGASTAWSRPGEAVRTLTPPAPRANARAEVERVREADAMARSVLNASTAWSR